MRLVNFEPVSVQNPVVKVRYSQSNSANCSIMGRVFYTICHLLLTIVLVGRADLASETIWFSDGSGDYVPAIVNPNIGLKFGFWGESDEKEQHVHFYLYTREAKVQQELIIGDAELLSKSTFDKSRQSKIIIHGFTNSDTTGFAPAAKQAYLHGRNPPPVNLIVVDWSKLAQAPWYNDAAGNTHLVGVKVARFIEFLVSQGSPLDLIHLIGHSLGAHVAGFAGSNLNMTLPRITALDPALPLFEEASDANRIDPSDAAFVDVIHTAGGSSANLKIKGRSALAFIEPRGHADFYVNGGKAQPGCGMDLFGACSHLRAYEYYLETVANPNGFPACECNSWEEYQAGKCRCSSVATLGENSSSSSAGMFYLRTRSKKPYATNET